MYNMHVCSHAIEYKSYSCTECLAMGSACGWCSVNKVCRGLPDDCTNGTNFLQVKSRFIKAFALKCIVLYSLVQGRPL